MNLRDFLIWTLLLTTLAYGVRAESGYKRPAGSKCRNIPTVDIDDDWFLEEGDVGFNYPYGSKLEATSGTDSPSVPPSSPVEYEFKKCWTIFTRVLGRTVPLQMSARFDRINQAQAEIQAEKTPSVAAVFQFYGDFTIVLTDNHTFALVYGCLFEMNAFWILVVPVGAELSEENKEKALTHVQKELKFGIKKKDLASDRDAVRFMASTIKTCDEEMGNWPAGSLKKMPAVPGVPKVG